jgi:hypothetical protein
METETMSQRTVNMSTYSNQNLMLDFEAEFAAFLSRDLPDLGPML